MNKGNKAFTYIYTKEKSKEYKKLSAQMKLEWLEKMSRFIYYFTASPKKA